MLQFRIVTEQLVAKIAGDIKIVKNIKVSFHYMDEDMEKKCIVSIILPRLEYEAVM